MGKPFLTLEDLKISFSLFCCVYGIGTLGMPGNYARAGYFWATLALVFMASVNTYATVCLSKVMLVAPKSVRTLGDLGHFCLGGVGRWAILITQMMTCVLVPIAFLVLGGIMCTIMFPDSYESTTWIVIMGLSLVPVCLVPTLKEGAFAAAAGSLGTLLADGIALYLLVDNMHDMNKDSIPTPSPDVDFKQVASVFGNLALAYGAGIVVPALQREHSDPSRMPRIIFVTLGSISCLFMIIAITGVSVVGCQIPGNLLFSIAGAPTKLGFTANRGGVILAMLFMQLHVTIAFAVIMMPGFYIFERVIFGLHKHNFDAAIEIESAYDKAETPADVTSEKPTEPLNKEMLEAHELDAATYRQPGVYPKIAAMRIVIIAAAVAIACAWEDKLLDLLDFTGASCIALSCMILPIVFYLRKCGANISLPERIWAYFAIAASLFLGGYVTYLSAKPLFNPDPKPEGPAKWDDPKFQFCPSKSSYANIVFTNVTYHKSFTS